MHARSDEPSLEALIAALSAPGALPGAGDGLTQVVQTHISAVFLTREHAFKLKKPVDFGFLDFSTAEKRQHFCREELRLNRRLAPEMYVGLAPVWHRPGGRVEVGPPVENPPPCDELLVAMTRLPQERMMDRLLAAGGVEPVHMERLARLVSAFHARADRGPDVERHGTREAAGRLAIENFDQTERFCGTLFDAGEHRRMRGRTLRFLESRERLFAGRLKDGRVREGHGDLHAPNICIAADGRPIVYDCIEFAAAYRCFDVASEVAFLVMDLDARGHAGLAEAFLDAYRAQAQDATLDAMLPFYRTYRAMVRAKISALTASAAEVPAALRERETAQARALFALAERTSRGMLPPALIVLSGLTGVGKTVVARALGHAAGLEPLETDRIRKKLAGLDPDKPAPAPAGSGIYTQAMTFATYRTLAREAATRLERGEGALAVGTFVTRGQRETVREAAREARVPLLFVRLQAPEDVVLARLAARPPGASDGDAAVYRAMVQREDPPDEIPAGERLELDASALTPPELADAVLARLHAPYES